MMNELKVIHEQGVLGKEFKVYGDKANPLFLAKDVADWIDYNPKLLSQMLKSVDDEEKGHYNTMTPGGIQNTWFLTEEGLYEVLMQSRKPIAKAFKKEVKVILKDIRKHGMYMTDNLVEQTLNNPDLMIELLTNYKREKEVRKALEGKIEAQRPKVEFAEAVEVSKGSIPIGQLATLLNQKGAATGEKRLFAWMRDNGYLRTEKAYKNDPKQRYVDQGLLEIKLSTRLDHNNIVQKTRKTLVTSKGIIYFVNKFLVENKNSEVI